MDNKIVLGIIITFIIICLVVLFCAILIKLYISKIKTYNQILYQKEVNQQKAINEAILETQDTTLNNIALELHDDAGQQLTSINFQLENLKITNPKCKDAIVPIAESVSKVSDTLRYLSHNMTNQKLKNLPLLQSIQNEVNRLNKLGAITFKLNTIEGFNYSFTKNEKIIIYRIFQEAVNNMLKHSKANTFTVTISDTKNLVLTFKDNGIGFLKENSNLENSNGVENMKTRAILIGFSFELHTKINKGTTITLTKL